MFPRNFFAPVYYTADYFTLGGGVAPPLAPPPLAIGIHVGIRIGL